MAGVNLGETQIFLQCGTPVPKGCSLYYVIDDADALCEFHKLNGIEIAEAIGDRSWDFRDYTIRDLNGYRLTFGHRLPERA